MIGHCLEYLVSVSEGVSLQEAVGTHNLRRSLAFLAALPRRGLIDPNSILKYLRDAFLTKTAKIYCFGFPEASGPLCSRNILRTETSKPRPVLPTSAGNKVYGNVDKMVYTTPTENSGATMD
jgi:hypothetical protein